MTQPPESASRQAVDELLYAGNTLAEVIADQPTMDALTRGHILERWQRAVITLARERSPNGTPDS